MKVTINNEVRLLLILSLLLSSGGFTYADSTYVYYFDTKAPISVKSTTGNGSCEFLGIKGEESKELPNGEVIEFNIYYFKCGASGENDFYIQSQGVHTSQGYMTCKFEVKNWSTGIFGQTSHHKVTALEHPNLCVAYGENNTWAARNELIPE